MNLKSIKEMNSLIMESQDIQVGEFISDKEKAIMESQTEGVSVTSLPETEYNASACGTCEQSPCGCESTCECGSTECKCGCEDGLCTCMNEIDGAAGTSEKSADAVMGCAETLPENLGIKNSLSAKPTLNESSEIDELVKADSDSESNDMGWMPAVIKVENEFGSDLPKNVKDDIFNKYFDSPEGQDFHQWNSLEMSERKELMSNYADHFKSKIKYGSLNESSDMGTVIDETAMKDAQEGSNIEDQVITKFNDVFIKEYKPQSSVKYDVDGTEAEVEVKEFKIPKGW
jgi:hypothetical protein